MGTAKYAEELRNKALKLAESHDEAPHQSIIESRSRPGRKPAVFSPEAYIEKQRQIERRANTRKQKQQDQAKRAELKRDLILETKARSLLSVLQPMIISENVKLARKNHALLVECERLKKHLKMLSTVVRSQKIEIDVLKRGQIAR